ncbi:MAG TPA: hypothetical protein VLA05_05135 [Coriobacteriia bacterium]|nr:hypothetical protein [Coriobacteriia bacterium]
MGKREVARSLIEYGRELEAAGAAQVGSSFSGNPDADYLLEHDPNAFLLAVLFTQGISAERAWQGPWLLAQRLGTLDVKYLAEHADAVRDAFQQAPMLHRFKETLPRWVTSAARRLAEDYDCDASRIWAEHSHVLEVVERLSAFEGIGRKKAVMATEILTRHFGVQLEGRECGQVAYDVHVRRVFLRAGLVDVDTRDAVEKAASELCPGSPGTLDLPAWLIGRETCRPKAPRCAECRIADFCPKRTSLTPEGVGVRRGERT